MVTSTEPKVDLGGRYSINETCTLLGIHRNTLRSYVEADFIRPISTHRTSKMRMRVPRMRFSGSEIVRFWRTFV